MKRSAHSFVEAFSLIELLIVVMCAAVLALLSLRTIARFKARSSRINCVNNLKQIGVAYRTWALDNGDKYPAQVSVTNGGTMELVESGTVYRHFQVMSNELSTPKILACPEDTARFPFVATTFAGTVPTGSANMRPFTSDTNVSYFVGVDANDTAPNMLLSGDANLSVDRTPLKGGLYSLQTNRNLGWYRARHENRRKGNIGLADGSVVVVNSAELKKALAVSGVINRLAIPQSP